MPRITPLALKKYYYRPHVSARQTAEHFGVSRTTIKNYLDKYGFRVKRRSEVQRHRKLTPEQRDRAIKNLKQFNTYKVDTLD